MSAPVELIADKFFFWYIQAAVILIVVRAIQQRKYNPPVKRGEKSIGIFAGVAAFLLTGIIAAILSFNSTLEGFKTALFLTNAYMVAHLCFRSRWFQNKLIGLLIQVENGTHTQK